MRVSRIVRHSRWNSGASISSEDSKDSCGILTLEVDREDQLWRNHLTSAGVLMVAQAGYKRSSPPLMQEMRLRSFLMGRQKKVKFSSVLLHFRLRGPIASVTQIGRKPVLIWSQPLVANQLSGHILL